MRSSSSSLTIALAACWTLTSGLVQVQVEGFSISSPPLALSQQKTSSTLSSSHRLLAFRQNEQHKEEETLSFDPTLDLSTSSSENSDELLVSGPGKASSAVLSSVSSILTVSSLLWMATSQSAMAAGPDWGIFEGRIGSLLHPITMGGLFLYSAYTAFLGFQWRRQRTMGDEISALKKTIPKPSVNAEGEELPPSPETKAILEQVAALTTERKELAAAAPRDQHFAQGALLAFLGTAFAIEGPLNTYARAGKLFPGPHLYAGAGLVFLWALAVSTIPSMQKGNDTARTIHIGANLTGLGLFAWQVTTGIPILLKVIEKTSWP